MVGKNVNNVKAKGKPIEISTIHKVKHSVSKNTKSVNAKDAFPNSKTKKPTDVKRSFPDSRNIVSLSPQNFHPDSENLKPKVKRPFADSKNNGPDQNFKKNNISVQSTQIYKKPKSSLLKKLNSDSLDKSASSQGNLKKKLRDAARLLKKETLDAETRRNMERRVKALKLEVSGLDKSKKSATIAKKYRKLRIIESSKVVRNIKKIENKLSEARASIDKKEEIPKLEDQLLNAQIDYNYIKHYPLNEKYISLFGSYSVNNEISKEANTKQQKIRDDIKNRMASGELAISKKLTLSTTQSKVKAFEEATASKTKVSDDFFAGDEENTSENDSSVDEPCSDNGESEDKSGLKDGGDKNESVSEADEDDEESNSEDSEEEEEPGSEEVENEEEHGLKNGFNVVKYSSEVEEDDESGSEDSEDEEKPPLKRFKNEEESNSESGESVEESGSEGNESS